MKRFFALCAILSMTTMFTVGCDKKTEVKKETKVTTPEGTTTQTDTSTETKSGENPPAAK